MKKCFKIVVFGCLFTFFSCEDKNNESNLQNKIQQLENKIAQLEIDLDECNNGETRLFERLKNNYDEGNDEAVIQGYQQLSSKFPGSKSHISAKELIEKSNERLRKANEELASAEKARLEERRKSLTKLKKSFDDVSGKTWYRQKYFTHYTNSNRTSVYMGVQEGSKPWLRLYMSYTGDDWIFFENAYLSYDGNTREFYFDKYKEKETENDSGDVWEWIDVQLSDSDIQWIKLFASSPNAKMRLSGKYTKTRNLSLQERRGILDVLDGYEFLNGESK